MVLLPGSSKFNGVVTWIIKWCCYLDQSLDHQKAPSPFLQYCVCAHDQDNYIDFLCVDRFIKCVHCTCLFTIWAL